MEKLFKVGDMVKFESHDNDSMKAGLYIIVPTSRLFEDPYASTTISKNADLSNIYVFRNCIDGKIDYHYVSYTHNKSVKLV